MSETTQTPAPASAPEHDRVGDLLRKERVTKRIALETIARDLKLNVKFIKSIEASDYNDLPADPYIRVYLRSMAKYLSLDPDEILKRFNKERGMVPAEEQADQATTKLDVSMNAHEPKKPKTPVTLIAGLVAVVIVLAFIASRLGHGSSAQSHTVAPIDTTAVKHPKPVPSDTIADSIPEKRPDSLELNGVAAAKTAALAAAAKSATAKDTTAKTGAKAVVAAPKAPAKPVDSLTLIVRAAKDSVWMQVFADGKVWKNTLPKGESRIFRARDSLNVHVGNNGAAAYLFNGMPATNLVGAGIVTFKADHSGIVQWPLTQWMAVFKNRMP